MWKGTVSIQNPALTHIHRRTWAFTLTATWFSMWAWRRWGKRNANARLFKSVTWPPWGDECVWKKSGDSKGKRKMALIHCVSPSIYARCCERYMLVRLKKMDDTLSGGWGVANYFHRFFTYSSHIPFPNTMWVLFILKEVLHTGIQFFLYSFPVFSSLSPMLFLFLFLFLHCQPASHVRAGFLGAHARWQDTATDLIAEKRHECWRWSERWMLTRLILEILVLHWHLAILHVTQQQQQQKSHSGLFKNIKSFILD